MAFLSLKVGSILDGRHKIETSALYLFADGRSSIKDWSGGQTEKLPETFAVKDRMEGSFSVGCLLYSRSLHLSTMNSISRQDDCGKCKGLGLFQCRDGYSREERFRLCNWLSIRRHIFLSHIGLEHGPIVATLNEGRCL